MATWVPTRAPNLWGHLFWGCPKYLRAMHVASLETLSLTGISAFQDSSLVSRPDALSTPHTWILCDLGLPLPLGVLLIIGVFPGDHLSWPNFTVRTTDGRGHIGLTLLLRIDV